jgi:hypothetical protein
MKNLVNFLIVTSLSLLMLAGQSYASQSNPSPNQLITSATQPLKQMQQLKFDSASASSFSIQPLNLRVPQSQENEPATDLVAMWKTPIPNLSVGYTVGNITVNPSTNNIQLNNNMNSGSFNALSIQFTGF